MSPMLWLKWIMTSTDPGELAIAWDYACEHNLNCPHDHQRTVRMGAHHGVVICLDNPLIPFQDFSNKEENIRRYRDRCWNCHDADEMALYFPPDKAEDE